MKRAAGVATVAALVFVGAPHAADPIHQPSLHVHMTGKKVKGLQWLLSGHRPSQFKLKTYTGPIDGRYDKDVRLAVKRMKFRIGYPASLLDGKVAGPYFFAVMKGKIVRPIEWVGLQGQRTKALAEIAARPPSCVTKILDAARSQLGVRETSTNFSSTIANYQRITGAYHAAWCVSFAQWVNVHAGIGPIADRSAGVNYVYNWAQHRGWVHSVPRPGAWVAFGYSHSTHMGIVERVLSSGSYYTIEGNHNNGVYRVLRSPHENYPVFLWQPCILG